MSSMQPIQLEGESAEPTPRDVFFASLDRMFARAETTEREHLAQTIYNVRQTLLQHEKIDPSHQTTTIADADGTVRFRNNNQIELAKKKLSSDVLQASETFTNNPSTETFTRAFGSIVALSELTLFMPKDIRESVENVAKNETKHVGINPAQIDAAISVCSSHITRVDSGQGKSNPDAVAADIAKVLLKNVQVHHMVNDPYARSRDSEQLLKMTNQLGLSVMVFPDTGDDREASSMESPIMQKELLSVIPETSRRTALLKSAEKHIAATTQEQAFARAKEVFLPEHPSLPDIAIGTGSDFRFARLRDEHPELWEKQAEAVIDEVDLPWNEDTAHVVESPEINTLKSYLPDWICLAAADTVCKGMVRRNEITPDEKGTLTLENMDGGETDDIFEAKFDRELTRIKKTGKLSQKLELALTERIRLMTHGTQEEFTINGADIKFAIPRLIRNLTPFPDTNTNGFFARAWMDAQLLKEGTEYRAQNGQTYIIDRSTGYKLASHQYQDLMDVAVDIAHSVCMLRPRSDQPLASSGFLSFLTTTYGKKHIAGLSATFSNIKPEIAYFTDNSLVESARWIGKPVERPDPFAAETQHKALAMLKQFAYTDQPKLIVTDDDHEIEAIRKTLQASLPKNSSIIIRTITSATSEEEEAAIYKHAGDTNCITIANPKAGRMIDIKTTKQADNAGGLFVVAWGPLYSNDVLWQLLARTKRAGHPGEAAWIVYKTGGYVGLSDHRLVTVYPKLKLEVENLPVNTTIPYEYGILEKLHTKQFEITAARRLQIYFEDITRESLVNLLPLHILDAFTDQDGKPLVTEKFIKHTLLKLYMPLIQSEAHQMTKSVGYNHSFADFTAFQKALADSGPETIRLAKTLATNEMASDIALGIGRQKLDAVKQIQRWTDLHGDLSSQKKPRPVPYFELQPPRMSASEPIATQVSKELVALVAEEFESTISQANFVLPELPNMLITVEKTVKRNPANPKNKPHAQEVSFRLTSIDQKNASIDDDKMVVAASTIQRNGMLSKREKGTVTRYVDLFSEALRANGAKKSSIRIIRKYLARKQIIP